MATGLSWDAFAAPPPELAEWQPNPDLVPVSGVRPDLRFNKDRLTAQQKKALKRDRLLGLNLDTSGEVSRVDSSATSTVHTDTPKNVGSWPAPAPRATGLHHAPAPTRAQHPPFSPPESLKPVDTLPGASVSAPAPAFKPSTFSEPGNGSKGTMETLPVHPLFERPHSPPTSLLSKASEPPPTTPTPAWARKFAHLLNGSPPKESGLPIAPLACQPLPLALQAASLSSASKPPHLRKQPHSRISATPVVSQEAFFNTMDVAVAPQNKVQSAAPPSVLPSSSSSHLYSLSDAASSDDVSSVDRITVQRRLLSSFIPKKASLSSIDHERYLKGKLISALEEEMDMAQRTTRGELHKMNDAELNTHFTKTKAMHKISWDTRQKKDLRASLVAFQETE